ncbi:N-acetyltransferase [Actinoplanes philippinensis]|uniref:Acetyltransferase (GNAT) family protein n=1 Tax=Actinoplanes philippinensis TaxID=35752 RepID=A0A1I2MSR6_9ACTN|nr:N-acetyltransferase [Actinoplanes philippinensis]SFF94158.1 Acetyltransferase (GNAT) family protein [Actinoplanes philippinensis]
MLALFDRQMRRDMQSEGDGSRIERDGPVIRHVGASPQAWNAVVWSDLDETTADAAIAGEVRRFAEIGYPFEWKLYGYDRPADLGERLIAAGFVPDDEETLMIAAISDLELDVPLPDGVRIDRVTDPAGVELMASVSEQAFGENADWLRHRLLDQLANDPGNAYLFVAMAGDEPVSGARMDLYRNTAFAGLWGGGTVSAWRGKGIYRALVAERARIAAAQGYEYVQVDASDQSRPILERLGFAVLTSTTPYNKS